MPRPARARAEAAEDDERRDEDDDEAEHERTQLIIANGYAYALFGGNPPAFSQTADQSGVPTVTSTTLTFPNWSNAAANLTNKLRRHGAVAESAYFYVVGGTTNDTDALATVLQILH